MAVIGLLATVVLASCAGGRGAASAPSTSGAPSAPTSASAPDRPAIRPRVLTVGDSGMVDATTAIGPALRAAGAEEVRSLAGPGFGLTGIGMAHVPYDWAAEWRGAISGFDPQLSVVMLGGWDLWYLEKNGADAYRDVLVGAAEILTSNGGQVIWLKMLPDDKGSQVAVNEVVSSLDPAVPGVHVVDPALAVAAPDGSYPPSFVGEDGVPVRLRKSDGWHLCQDGAARIAEQVRRSAEALGLAGPAAPGWDRGAWRQDQTFESPACWPLVPN